MNLRQALEERMLITEMHYGILLAQRISDAIARSKFTQEENMVLIEWRREVRASTDAIRKQVTS